MWMMHDVFNSFDPFTSQKISLPKDSVKLLRFQQDCFQFFEDGCRIFPRKKKKRKFTAILRVLEVTAKGFSGIHFQYKTNGGLLFPLLTAFISKFIFGVIISAGANVAIDKVMDPAGAPLLIDPSSFIAGIDPFAFWPVF